MSDTFNAAIRRTALTELHAGVGDVDMVCDTILAEHSALLAEHGQRLLRDAIKRQVKNLFRDLSEDDGAQLALPGLRLPTAIAFALSDGSVGYVASENATWDQLVAGLAFRDKNIAAAQAKREQYVASLDLLHPYMADCCTRIWPTTRPAPSPTPFGAQPPNPKTPRR